MQKVSLSETLKGNSYPGRGIVIGRSEDGRYAVTAYFIMGRSVNSRNRVFVRQDDGIRTEAFDISKLSDPSLIIYAPVKVLDDITIVTNGDQTDTVYDLMSQGRTFEEALRTREFEPDAPNYTPRISAVLKAKAGEMEFAMSILKSDDGDAGYCIRNTYSYPGCPAGEGRFIHTYMMNADPLPSYEGEPEKVDITGDIDEFSALVWDSLDEDNKVSLFVRYIDIETGRYDTRIINKNR